MSSAFTGGGGGSGTRRSDWNSAAILAAESLAYYVTGKTSKHGPRHQHGWMGNVGNTYRHTTNNQSEIYHQQAAASHSKGMYVSKCLDPMPGKTVFTVYA